MGLLVLGIFLLLYGGLCLVVALAKFPAIWNISKIQMFIRFLGEIGTQLFIGVWGLIAFGFGIWLTFFL